MERRPEDRMQEILGTERDAKMLHRVNATAADNYYCQGPGEGGSRDIINKIKQLVGVDVGPSHAVLDVGFGKGHFLREAKGLGCRRVAGVDIAPASIDEFNGGDHEGYELHCLDMSHSYLPFADDSFDIVACTETIEHVYNPHFVVAEIKRILVPDGIFLMAFPQPEDNFGYGPGQHAHVYPGFLRKDSYEIFMRDRFFRLEERMPNGSTAWYIHTNYKGEGIIDINEIVSGNYDEAKLFAPVKGRILK